MDSLEGYARHPEEALSANLFGGAMTFWVLALVVVLRSSLGGDSIPRVPHPDDLTDRRIAIEHRIDGGRTDVVKLLEAVEAEKPTWDQRRQLRLYQWEKAQAAVEAAHAAEQAWLARWAGGLLGGTGLLVLLAALWVYATRPVRVRLDRRWMQVGKNRHLIEDDSGVASALDELERYEVEPALLEALQHAHHVLRDAEELPEAHRRALAALRT